MMVNEYYFFQIIQQFAAFILPMILWMQWRWLMRESQQESFSGAPWQPVTPLYLDGNLSPFLDAIWWNKHLDITAKDFEIYTKGR